jgi:plastocyanin
MTIQKRKPIIILAALLVLGGIAVWGIQRGASRSTQDNTDGKTIIIREDGFFPDKLTVPVGTTVTFVNEDTYWHWPASDPHPSHTFYSALDPKAAIKPGGTWQVTLTQSGEWGIHDHLAPYVVGILTVK